MKAQLFIVLLLLSIGCVQQKGDEMVNLSGKKILMVVAPANFRDEELLQPKEIFEKTGARVVIASKNASTATGTLGAKINVDKDISEISVSDYDAIIFIGGPGSSQYFNDSRAHIIAKESVARDKVLGAICIAPSILANAGVLKGKKATAFSSESANLRAKGAEYTGAAVTQDGKIITANGPGAASEFGKKIAEAIR